MSSSSAAVDAKSSLRMFWWRFGWLCAVGVALFVASGTIGSWTHGAAGWGAAAVAVGACLAGGAVALALMRSSRGSGSVSAPLTAMAARMGIPAAAAIALAAQGETLLDAGALEMILVSYLTMLAVETWLVTRT